MAKASPAPPAAVESRQRIGWHADGANRTAKASRSGNVSCAPPPGDSVPTHIKRHSSEERAQRETSNSSCTRQTRNCLTPAPVRKVQIIRASGTALRGHNPTAPGRRPTSIMMAISATTFTNGYPHIDCQRGYAVSPFHHAGNGGQQDQRQHHHQIAEQSASRWRFVALAIRSCRSSKRAQDDGTGGRQTGQKRCRSLAAIPARRKAPCNASHRYPERQRREWR